MKGNSNEIDHKLSKTDMANAKEVLQLSREVGNSDLWKIYGRESEAGKMLFKLFGKGPNSIKVDYPKPKTMKKPLPFQESRKLPNMIPASKTMIEYPEIKSNKKPLPRIHAVDLIPKRKNEVEIKKEIEDFYSKPDVPVNKGVNRKQLVEDLQAKFKKQRGALPKAAELPLYNEAEFADEITEEEIKQKALQKIPKKLVTYTYQKPKDPDSEKKGMSKNEQQEELEKLYEDVVAEIEERQQYLEEIAHLDEPKIKDRVKKEIVDRVAELQKIIKMLRKED